MQEIRHNRPAWSHLHPLIYAVIVGLAVLFVISAWGFAGAGYSDLVLAVVSAFVLTAMAIPYVLWRVGRSRGADSAEPTGGMLALLESLRGWLDGELDTWQGQVKGSRAVVEILAPLAAVAFGMTALAIVLHFVAPG